MPPTEQRFRPAHALLTQIEHRLVREVELTTLECRMEVRLELEAFPNRYVHCRGEHDVASATARLRSIERHVGVAQQF